MKGSSAMQTFVRRYGILLIGCGYIGSEYLRDIC